MFWRITDNWLEMSLRFLVASRGVCEIKDAITRQVLAELDAAGIRPRLDHLQRCGATTAADRRPARDRT